MIPNHNGCLQDNKRVGSIGFPKDYLADVQDNCINGDAVCLDEGKDACDRTSSCEGFSMKSGIGYPVKLYNGSGFNESNFCSVNCNSNSCTVNCNANSCSGPYGLSKDNMWNTYKKISYSKKLSLYKNNL